MERRLRRGVQWHVLAWGLVAALSYLIAGVYVWPAVPLRILYEGEAPPLPYRWVRPPNNLPEPNQAPTPGEGTIPISGTASQAASVLTDDGQAALIFRAGAIAPHSGASSVRVRITPLDPAPVAPPPQGLRFDGNAYRMEATYNTGEPIMLLKPATPVLRYPKHATTLLRSTGAGWTALETRVVAGSLQLFGPADRLGVFVAAGPLGAPSIAWGTIAAITAAVVGVLAAVFAALFAQQRRSRS